MLKIKDPVDLKELEKFGFAHVLLTDSFQKQLAINSKITICRKTRFIEIEVQEFQIEVNDLSTLFDLIQAGLVEKV